VARRARQAAKLSSREPALLPAGQWALAGHWALAGQWALAGDWPPEEAGQQAGDDKRATMSGKRQHFTLKVCGRGSSVGEEIDLEPVLSSWSALLAVESGPETVCGELLAAN